MHVEVPQAYGVNILFRIGSIAITVPVAIAVFLAIAVVPAVLAVAVIVAVLLLFHVQAVDNGAQTGQTLVGVQLVDELVVVLMRIVGTAYVNADVGDACYELRVGDHADRGGVEHDIVVVFFQQFDGIVQGFARQQLRGVGRDSSAGQDVEVGRQVRRLYHASQICTLRSNQILGDTAFLVRNMEP